MVDVVVRTMLSVRLGMANARVKMVQVGFRFPETVLSRLDESLERERGEQPGRDLTRADLVRQFVLDGLDRSEARGVQSKGRKKG